MKWFLFIICLVLAGRKAYSQADCQCDYTIIKSGNYDNAGLKIKPGQTVCIQAGHYDYLRFVNFAGIINSPIRFINCGGQVTIGSDGTASLLQFHNSTHFVFSGSGLSSVPYGFALNKDNTSSAMGVSVSGFSSDYEIERIDMQQITYAGFFCKLDPGCDSASWRGNYEIDNVKIHDNYLHDIYGLGMFLGSGYSATLGTTVTCNKIKQTVYPLEMTNLQVYNNRIDRTANAGIQVTNAPGARVYNNIVTSTNLGPKSTGLQAGGSDCGCDFTITKADAYNNAWFGIGPGKTVCIRAGHYNYLRLANFVGAPGQPIRFKNCGGQVTAGSASGGSGITVSNSRYFAISGTGNSDFFYGIKLSESNNGDGNNMGVSVGSLSSDCELDHIEVGAAGFAGIMVKTDPSCDSTTWRGNFNMYNVKIHDNYIHDTGGEGLYIGNSFYGEGMLITCGEIKKRVYPHLIYGLEIYNNRTLRTGCEGIQYSCAPDAQVHDNVINTTGVSPFAAYQNNGLQVSGGSGGDCYNNTIIDAPGSGIAVVGHLGGNRIFNNVINRVGVDGIFCDDRAGSLPGTTVQLINNTINRCGRDGIRLYNEINSNTVANNAITAYGLSKVSSGYITGKPMVFEQGATAILLTNFMASSTKAARYKDADNNDFSLTVKSPLIGAGINASRWGTLVDRSGRARPANTYYTVGAYEFDLTGSGTPQSTEEPDKNDLVIYPVPFSGQLTIQWPEDRVIKQLTIYAATGQKMGVWTPGQDGQKTITVLTTEWASGAYVYQADSEEGVTSGRLVKP